MARDTAYLGSSFFTFRRVGQTTAVVVLEAEVRTQVGFLPHWLFVTTAALAALSILVVTIEGYLQRYNAHIAKAMSISVVTAFLLSVGYAFFGDLSPAPFRANILATTEYVGASPFSLFMVEYNSRRGSTASPITYLMYLEAVNNQPFETRIDSYSIEIGRWRYLPGWHTLPAIPIDQYPVYAIGVVGASPHPFALLTPKGSYLLDDHPEWRDKLAHAVQMTFNPLFIDELRKPIAAHHTIQGWAAFDRADDIVNLKGKYLRITLRDTSGTTSRSVTSMPLPVQGEVDTSKAIMQPTNTKADLSGCYLKFYAEP